MAELYESASVTITAGSREQLFAVGRAELDKLFGKDCYRITSVSYNSNSTNAKGAIVNGTMYATYLGEPI